MDTLKVNTKGQEFIELRKKKIKQFIYIFPVLFLFSITAGIIKLGISGYSIAVILLTFPVLFIVLQTGVIKPKRVINNLIIKIELNDEKVVLYTNEIEIKPSNIKLRSNFQIFESIFNRYYIVSFNSKEYYIIPEFFDDFKIVEDSLNFGGVQKSL